MAPRMCAAVCDNCTLSASLLSRRNSLFEVAAFLQVVAVTLLFGVGIVTFRGLSSGHHCGTARSNARLSWP
jgi:hypothetical protein